MNHFRKICNIKALLRNKLYLNKWWFLNSVISCLVLSATISLNTFALRQSVKIHDENSFTPTLCAEAPVMYWFIASGKLLLCFQCLCSRKVEGNPFTTSKWAPFIAQSQVHPVFLPLSRKEHTQTPSNHESQCQCVSFPCESMLSVSLAEGHDCWSHSTCSVACNGAIMACYTRY